MPDVDCELLAFGESLADACRTWLGTTLGGRFRLIGRSAFLAFRYRPHALQIVAPWGDLLQRGVRVVLQLLWKVRKARVHKHGGSYLQT